MRFRIERTSDWTDVVETSEVAARVKLFKRSLPGLKIESVVSRFDDETSRIEFFVEVASLEDLLHIGKLHGRLVVTTGETPAVIEVYDTYRE